MADKAKVTYHPEYVIDKISPRLFGAFLEPIGSTVNSSMYNPEHPTAEDKAEFFYKEKYFSNQVFSKSGLSTGSTLKYAGKPQLFRQLPTEPQLCLRELLL